MNDQIKKAFQRQAKAVALRPAIGRGTAVTTVTVTDGLTCAVDDGDWKFRMDMPEKHGGANRGPNPGVLGRAALGACAAMVYTRWAALMGVPIDELTVRVEADYDVGGELGVADVPPGYLAIRYVVDVASPAPETDVLRLLNAADEHCAFIDNFARAVPLRREVRFRRRAA